MKTQNDLLYAKTHEWLKIDGSRVRIGITDFAQDALGAIVFVELPEKGADLSAGSVLAVTESVKAASEIYTPVAGRVVEVNQDLVDQPERINDAPYESWIAVLDLADAKLPSDLMDEAAYLAFCQKEHA